MMQKHTSKLLGNMNCVQKSAVVSFVEKNLVKAFGFKLGGHGT